ncbi:MAG: hypothetical protein B7Z65_03425 [Ferrovum sp. 21-44-67]|nr:MAG: hypothetical protein B7Z65_03425 [Ferrovum sp. 21-44-67]
MHFPLGSALMIKRLGIVLSHYKTWWWLWALSLVSAIVLWRILFLTQPPGKPIIVANRDLVIGHEISGGDLSLQIWPSTTLPKGYFSDTKPLIHSIIHVPVYQGLPVLENHVSARESLTQSFNSPRLITLNMNDSDIDMDLLSTKLPIDLWYRETNHPQHAILIQNTEIEHIHTDLNGHQKLLTVKLTHHQLEQLPILRDHWQLTILLHPEALNHTLTKNIKPIEIIRGTIQ